MTGYSGTPLARKLGLKPGQRVWRSGMPASVSALIDREIPGLAIEEEPDAGLDVAHIFTASRGDLADRLASLRGLIASDGMVWVSWPKKASGIASEVTEDVVRELALPLGFVDVKVCAVDEIWSGLKLVIRKALRGGEAVA
jgi:hypothetical protein